MSSPISNAGTASPFSASTSSTASGSVSPRDDDTVQEFLTPRTHDSRANTATATAAVVGSVSHREFDKVQDFAKRNKMAICLIALVIVLGTIVGLLLLQPKFLRLGISTAHAFKGYKLNN